MIHPQVQKLIKLYDQGSVLCDKYRADISRIMSIYAKLTDNELKQLPPSIQALPNTKTNTQDFTNSPGICDEINQNHQRAQELREAQEKQLRADYGRLARHQDIMYEDRLDGRITVDIYDKLVKKRCR